MEKSKINYIINSSIVSIILIIASIFSYNIYRGDMIAYFIIIPTIIFTASHITNLFTETDFSKRSYKISTVLSYISILFFLITLILGYQISHNSSASPGAGAILILIPFVGIAFISLIASYIFLIIGITKKSTIVSENPATKISPLRKLLVVINIIIFCPLVIWSSLFAFEIVTGAVHNRIGEMSYSYFVYLAIASLLFQIVSFATLKKQWLFRISQILLILTLLISTFLMLGV